MTVPRWPEWFEGGETKYAEEMTKEFSRVVNRGSPPLGGSRMPLLEKVTCPHCWAVFETHSVLWVSTHPVLLGDPRLGRDAQKRFLPSRFTAEGFALDEGNSPCQRIACPHCHLEIPRASVEMDSCIVSIIGAPASGKSFYLGALAKTLRDILPLRFRVSFTDSDLVLNKMINHYELAMFKNERADSLIPLGELIPKTGEAGDWYSRVLTSSGDVLYPRPFMFNVRPEKNHPHVADPELATRVLCLYDNAGESFLAGSDSSISPVTRHLAQAGILLFLFDPTQDYEFSRVFGAQQRTPGREDRIKLRQQETILTEAANRVRALINIPATQKHDKLLFVVVTKQDLWGHLVPEIANAPPLLLKGPTGIACVNSERIAKVSAGIQRLLIKHSSAIVDAADSFAQKVIYVGVSSLGFAPVRDASGSWAIRPRDIKPVGVEAPLLYGLNKLLPGMFPSGHIVPFSK